MIDDALRSRLASAEYGSLMPVLPTTDTTLGGSRPRGHDFDVARATIGYSQLYGTYTVSCEVCRELDHEHATWALVDPFAQVAEPGQGLELVVTPPSTRGGLGQITLHVDRRSIADVDLMICGPCRRAVLEQIRVDQECQRRGFGRLLVAAALARAPIDYYYWSTTSLNSSTETRAFWSRVPFSGALGEPNYCSDMRTAAGMSEC